MQLNLLWMLTDGNNEPINVGIIDTNFDLNHRDIHYTKTYELPTDENGNISSSDSDHGTYVAGIIGAIHDNNRCISGIAPNARLYCDSIDGDHDYYDLPLFRFNYIISQMLSDGVRIINMSWGYTELSASAYYDAVHNVAVENSSALTENKMLVCTDPIWYNIIVGE